MNKRVEELVEWVALYLATEDYPNRPEKELGILAKTTPYPERTRDILSHPDLALIDSDQTAPTTQLEENSPPYKGMITQDYLNGRLSILEAGFKKVIPLKEAK